MRGFFFTRHKSRASVTTSSLALRADIEGLKISGGAHRVVYADYHRLLSKVFPFGVFYTMEGRTAWCGQFWTSGEILSGYENNYESRIEAIAPADAGGPECCFPRVLGPARLRSWLSMQYTNGYMKNSLSVAAILLALTASLAISQDLPSTLPSRNAQTYVAARPSASEGHASLFLFYIGGKRYSARICHDEVKAGPDWKPSMPLPLSYSKAEEIARTELKKLAGDPTSWEVTDLQLRRIPSEDQPKWFYVVTMEPREQFYMIGSAPRPRASVQRHDSFIAVMNLSGVGGKIEESPVAR